MNVPATPRTPNHIATIRTITAEYSLSSDCDLTEVADKWMEFLNNHTAWNRSPSAGNDLERASLSELGKLGFKVESDDIRKLANAGLAEVRLEAGDNNGGAPARIPWEFLLSSATRRYRSQVLIVIRHFVCSKSTQVDTVPERLLVVKSNPGYIAYYYPDDTLDHEQDNVAGNLGSDPYKCSNPTQVELLAKVKESDPHVVHLAGIDAMQGKELQEQEEDAEPIAETQDAMILKGANDSPVPVSSEKLAEAICAGDKCPILVACNFYRSSSIAARIVEGGAQTAIGFQSEIDDVQAEVFYFNFYLAWRLSNWKMLDAFKLALNEMMKEAAYQVRFAGVVLWSRNSLLDPLRSEYARGRSQTPPHQPTKQLFNSFQDERNKLTNVIDGQKAIVAIVSPLPELNYSLLHNNRSLFHYFYVRKVPVLGQIKNVRVELELQAGQEPIKFETRKDMKYTIWALHDEIRIQLTATLLRSIRESIYSSLHIKVSIAADVVYESTHRINLLPVDQWQDDPLNRKWLPSFVLPRDAAVIRIVDAAQKFLISLADDPHAGFSGYQTPDEGVDVQVQAIWYALIEDFSLEYVNPPPSFTRDSQRLRTPSDVLDARRGTCIDLALLLASCLEYIDVHPFIFLLEGHAFVGYMRREEAASVIREWVIWNAKSEEDNWMLGKEFYSTLIELVQMGDIVPIETVLVTQRRGFWDAVAEGGANLRSKSEFEFLVDVKMARANAVTPLPIWNTKE
jgi:hypothetical protein